MDPGLIILAAVGPLSFFGGISLIVRAESKSKVDRIKAERAMWQQPAAPAQTDAVLDEIRSLKRQVQEMQSTGHQFDISFDAAISRLEQRVERLETKNASQTRLSQSEEQSQQIGLR